MAGLHRPRGAASTSIRVGLAALAMTAIAACSAPHRGPVSDHFDGTRFFNPGQVRESSVAGYLWLRLTTAQGAWPASVPPRAAPTVPPPVVDGDTLRVTMVGHATLLIQVGGLNVLTDPIWSDRASPFTFAGPKRVSRPGVEFDALPRVDVVLISHDHYDHLDLATLRRLDARDRPRVIVPLGNRARVSAAMPASEVTEHDWGERVRLRDGIDLHVEPMVHGSGRGPFDAQRTLWAAYLLKAAGLTVWFVGDTGFGDGGVWSATGRRHGPIDLAILPIGAYEPRAFMADSHMGPEDALRVADAAGARHLLAHHHDTFQLGFEAYGAAADALRKGAAAAGRASDSLTVLAPGEAMTLTRRR